MRKERRGLQIFWQFVPIPSTMKIERNVVTFYHSCPITWCKVIPITCIHFSIYKNHIKKPCLLCITVLLNVE